MLISFSFSDIVVEETETDESFHYKVKEKESTLYSFEINKREQLIGISQLIDEKYNL